MGLRNKIAQYKAQKRGVLHCTFNPEGPGVVRLHLVPPRFRLFQSSSYVLILNGYYLLPVGYSWAVLLSSFMDAVNAYDGKEIGEEEQEKIFSNTLRTTCRVYPTADPATVKDDLLSMLDVLFSIAAGGEPDAEIEKLSIRAYARNMKAPHRMDLMVSAMTDENGAWKCNQKCAFCYAAGQLLGSTRELSTVEWKTVIDKLRAAGVPMLTFTGGEPTLRNDLPELIEHAKWFVTRLNTNGVCLTEELVAGLKAASLDSLQVTLYSSNEAVHNALVGSEHFADTVRGIQNAVRAGLDVSVNTPLCKRNADYLETLRFLQTLGVRFVTVSGLICTGGANIRHQDYDLSSNELYEIVAAAKAFCVAHGMEIDFTSPGLIEKERLEALGMNVPACGAALSNMAIAPDGTVVPCQSWLGDADLGNILEQPFKNIWKHPKCIALRGMREEESLSCPFRKQSKGGATNGK